MFKRSLFVCVLLASILLTACMPAPVVNVTNNNNNQNTVEVNVVAPAAPAVQVPTAIVSEPTKAPEATATVAPAAGIPNNPPTPAVTEPVQLKDMQDVINYPLKVKYRIGNKYYCVAVARGAAMPAGHTPIESWDAQAGDGDYLHTAGDFGMAAFCSDDPVTKHYAPTGTTWTTGLLEIDGFHPTTFPLQ